MASEAGQVTLGRILLGGPASSCTVSRRACIWRKMLLTLVASYRLFGRACSIRQRRRRALPPLLRDRSCRGLATGFREESIGVQGGRSHRLLNCVASCAEERRASPRQYGRLLLLVSVRSLDSRAFSRSYVTVWQNHPRERLHLPFRRAAALLQLSRPDRHKFEGHAFERRSAI